MDSKTTDSTPSESNERPAGRFMVLLRPYLGSLLALIALLGLLAWTSLALPEAIHTLIDDVFNRPDKTSGERIGLLVTILLALVGIYLARNALFYASRMLALKISEDLSFSLRKRLFEHLQQLSMRFYQSNQPGRVGARVMDDTFKLQSFLQEKFPTLLLNVAMFQVLLIRLFMMNAPLTVAAVIILPLQYITYRRFRVSIKQSSSEAQENMASAYANLIEKYLGMEVVKGFSAEARESASFNRAIDASRSSQIRSQRFHFSQKVVADLLVGFGTILLLGYGALEVIKGNITSGIFVGFFMCVGMMYPAVLAVISGAGHLSRATASIDRIFEMLDVPALDEGVNSAEVSGFEITEGNIQLRKVSFAFEGTDPILENINLNIRAGERISITGPSGSGKSTMLNLLPRFNRVTEGSVHVGGHDVNKTPVRSLRAGISIAFQEVFLFNTSILENLRYAKPDATMDEIHHVCAITGADDVVDRLPDGFATRIGEYGGELSRGEKQRITLARALLKNAPILILDEATASIDTASAHKMIERIFEDEPSKTILLVTHDAGLHRLTERTIAIQQGRIVFDGASTTYLEQLPDTSVTVADSIVLNLPESAQAPTAKNHAPSSAKPMVEMAQPSIDSSTADADSSPEPKPRTP